MAAAGRTPGGGIKVAMKKRTLRNERDDDMTGGVSTVLGVPLRRDSLVRPSAKQQRQKSFQQLVLLALPGITTRISVFFLLFYVFIFSLPFACFGHFKHYWRLFKFCAPSNFPPYAGAYLLGAS